MQPPALRVARRNVRQCRAGHLQQTIGVGYDASQELLPGLGIIPVNARLSLHRRAKVAPQAMFAGPPLRVRAGGGSGGQFPRQLYDPIGQQVVGVLERSPAQDVGGVQNDLEPAAPEVARPAREVQTLAENRLHTLVDNQTRPKQLQRALGEGSLLEADSQRDFPAQIEVRLRLCFLIGDSFVGLQKQRRRQKARGDARAPVVRAVEVGEVLVAEQLPPVQSEEAVEGVPPHVIEVGMLAAVRIRLPPEHLLSTSSSISDGSVLKPPTHEDFSATLLERVMNLRENRIEMRKIGR